MPTYDYLCECGEAFEKVQKISDREHATCPSCGMMANQTISAPLVKLNGCDPSFPGAYNKWGNDRRRAVARAERKSEN